MSVPLLDLHAQYERIAGQVDQAIREVVRSQRFILGPAVERIEREIGGRVGVPHAVGCASGTDALLLAFKALELEPNAEVVVPAFTFFASAGAVWNAGLRPVFCDVDPVTFNVTSETVEAAVTPRTRAVVVVHLFGQMAPMSGILELAEARGLAVIEDAAQAIDAAQNVGGQWRRAGSMGTAGTFSFFPSKNLGGFGDGGLITTSDDVFAGRLRKLRVHGGAKMYQHEMVGTNSRLDALQAAVLSAKLPFLEAWTEARRTNAGIYGDLLGDLPEIEIPVETSGNRHVYNQFTVRATRRAELREHLDAQGIGSAVYYPVPLHLQPCFRELGGQPGDLPVAESAAAAVLSLPIYPELTEDQIGQVADSVRAYYA